MNNKLIFRKIKKSKKSRKDRLNRYSGFGGPVPRRDSQQQNRVKHRQGR